jgi:serine/threonine-protein kinase
VLKARHRIGKYRILRKLGSGGFAVVFKAFDTVEGVPVALKVPHLHVLTPQAVVDFLNEIRLTAGLDHPNILPLKNAEYIDGRLVVAYPLGEQTLADRLQRRLSVETALDLAEQMLEALAYAHGKRIIHCDVKPPNLILFHGSLLRLTDFGISKVAMRTLDASGSGTVGYIAPEQAMGKPSFRSDVFSSGLVIYRMLSGALPEWPFQWPLPGLERLKRKVPSSFIDFLKRALQVNHRKRFPDAGTMLDTLVRLRPAVRRFAEGHKRRRTGVRNGGPDWRALKRREFMRLYRRSLALTAKCSRCSEPVAESMAVCPWCGARRKRIKQSTAFPSSCKRCGRGRKLDWRFCGWCFGPGFEEVSERSYTDRRYEGRCSNPGCTHKVLMPFMRYCPWCRQKVRRRWPIQGSKDRCSSCGSGVVKTYWDYCPWCGRRIKPKARKSP